MLHWALHEGRNTEQLQSAYADRTPVPPNGNGRFFGTICYGCGGYYGYPYPYPYYNPYPPPTIGYGSPLPYPLVGRCKLTPC